MRRRAGPVVAAVLLAAVTACGVPDSPRPVVVDPAEVPYGLLEEARPAQDPEPEDQVPPDQPRVFFLGSEDRLVALPLEPAPGAPPLLAAVGALSAGPDADSRERGLGTAIPPGLTLAVTRLEQRTATIDLRGETGPTGEQGPRAVAQIVLTATSVPQVDQVLLTRQGQPLEAQLPDGALTAAPLRAADYRSLVRGG